MFESANLDHVVDKASYRREEPKLREALLNAQFDLAQQARFPVLIVIGGVEGAGKSETVNLLNEWMDPRHIHTHAFPLPSDEERERPRMWRFWRALPPRGKLGIFFGAWHSQPIVNRVMGRISGAQLDQHVAEILRFEQMLADEGVLLLKFWFHLTREQQKKRLEALAKSPRTRWRVTDLDWKYFKRYDRFVRVAERYSRATSTAEAPWIVVSGSDAHYRNLTVGRTLLAALQERLGARRPAHRPERTPPLLPSVDRINVLAALDLGRSLPAERYAKQLEKWQGRLALLARHPKFARTGVVAVFEGADAAGKGGAIRRVTGALDARQYRGLSVAAPTEEERAQPYLWRFWRHLPRRGRFVLFDRSWYGRVLVERVEGLCDEGDWMRAYGEINDFEQAMVAHGLVVAKFWLAISKQEQLLRFKAREKTSFKRFKLTPDDWRNRKKWEAYAGAVCDMVDRTSTHHAPWTLVEANDKRFARIKVLKTLCAAIESRLDGA
jgi:polyphosphate:AMP phosphotransferase